MAEFDNVGELKKSLLENKVVIGAEVTVKLLRQGKVKKVFLTANCKPKSKEDIEQWCKVSNVECVHLTQTNEEMGTLCRKPFSISVVGISV